MPAAMRNRIILIIILLAALIALAAFCGTRDTAPTTTTVAIEETTTTTAAPVPTTTTTLAQDGGSVITTASGLQYEIIEEGDGEQPKVGDIVSVHYTGTLTDGTVFDSSVTRGQPITFPLGVGRVIPGWDEGIALLKVGTKARFTIPSNLAYGASGTGSIPGGATLIFDVDLIEIIPGPPDAPAAVAESDYEFTDSGVKYATLEPGDGASPEAGELVTVHYTGWLTDGTMFDSSLSRGTPFQFVIGQGQVIAGWDDGVASMKIGEYRQLVIPPELGYGDSGAGNVIPPGASLIFEVELLGIG